MPDTLLIQGSGEVVVFHVISEDRQIPDEVIPDSPIPLFSDPLLPPVSNSPIRPLSVSYTENFLPLNDQGRLKKMLAYEYLAPVTLHTEFCLLSTVFCKAYSTMVSFEPRPAG